MRAIGDRVLVMPDKQPDRVGLILTVESKEVPIVTGQVISTGRGVSLKNGTIRPMQVNVGDRVLFHRWMDTPIKVEIDQKEHFFIKEENIQAIVEN